MNSTIEHARLVAREILKPTERDLHHGLELHRESFVFESYSLGLRAPVVPETVDRMLDSGAGFPEIVDFVGEQQAIRWLATRELRREYQEAFEAAGVSCQCVNAGEEGNDPVRLLKRLARQAYLIDRLPDLLVKVTRPADLELLSGTESRGIVLTLNGVPLPGTQATLEEELGLIRIFAQLGVGMMHLTYNRRNPLGDGCAETANAGLSDFGRAGIREMNRCGVIVDVAHCGMQTSLEAALESAHPIVASHTTAFAVTPHIRAKSDEVICAIAAKGGLIGITNVPVMLGRSGDIAAMLDHLDYVIKKAGSDCVGIGTDSAYVSVDSAAPTKSWGRARARWEGLWPEGFLASLNQWKKLPQAESLAWTNWPLFTVGLVQRGYDDATIRKIIGGNMRRVFQEVRGREEFSRSPGQ